MRCESAEAFWAVRFRELLSPPHQGDSLRLEDPEPSSLRSLQVLSRPRVRRSYPRRAACFRGLTPGPPYQAV